MKYTIIFLTLIVFFFSGIIPGTVCTITKSLKSEDGIILTGITESPGFDIDFVKTAWAGKKKDNKPGKDKTPGKDKKGKGIKKYPIPEPSTWLLLCAGLFGVVLLRKKFKKSG